MRLQRELQRLRQRVQQISIEQAPPTLRMVMVKDEETQQDLSEWYKSNKHDSLRFCELQNHVNILFGIEIKNLAKQFGTKRRSYFDLGKSLQKKCSELLIYK